MKNENRLLNPAASKLKTFGGPGWAWLPNLFTGANLVCGFLAILFSLEAFSTGESALFNVACWLILWATILDFLDGFLAKLTNSASLYGMKMDTFADAVTFGLAPAILIVTSFTDTSTPMAIAWGAAGAYFLCAAWRLARYNVQDGNGPSFGFVGLPSPTAAVVTVSMYVSNTVSPLAPGAIVAGLIILGFLMVSPLRYPAFKRLQRREGFAVLVVLMGIFTTMGVMSVKYGVFVGFGKALLLWIGSFSLIWGPWWIPTRHLWNPGLKAEPLTYRPGHPYE